MHRDAERAPHKGIGAVRSDHEASMKGILPPIGDPLAVAEVAMLDPDMHTRGVLRKRRGRPTLTNGHCRLGLDLGVEDAFELRLRKDVGDGPPARSPAT